MTEVFQCNCKHEFQDELYGKNMRLFNVMEKDKKVLGYRCTVCGNVLKSNDGKKK